MWFKHNLKNRVVQAIASAIVLGACGAMLSLAVGACAEQATRMTQDDRFLRDLGAALDAMDSPAGPCVMCGVPSDSKQDRKTLTLDNQLIEFCGQACAGKFYENPNWREFRVE